jgi:hypothetical protein
MPRGTAENRAAFDDDTLLREAQANTGLSDYGTDPFREPLSILLRSLREEAPLSELGRTMLRARVVESLETRLQTEDWVARHPEILEEEVEAPLVVVGQARTGSTMLQRVLGSDPRHHAGLWWEVRFPAPFPGTRWEEPDPRIPRAEAEVAAILQADPGQAAIHPWDAQAPDEEIMLLEHTFLSFVPEAFADVPSYRAWITEQDWTPAYVYLHKFVQFLQWQKRQRGEVCERWVLKAPNHLGFIDTLFEVFQGARIVWTHRDPIETIPSAASMNHHLWEIYCDEADPHEAGRQWKERMAWTTQRCLESRSRLPEDCFADIWFRDALTRPIEEIERVYEIFGIEMTPEARAAMEGWVRNNPRNKRPAHQYTLEDFGFTEEEIFRDFADYRERFILPHLS